MKVAAAGFCIVAVLLTSCATFRQSERLDVTLVSVQFGQSTVLETTMSVIIRLSNRSSESLGVVGGVHKIYLNGVYVGEGLSDQTMEVPRLSSVTQTITTHVQNLRLISRIRDILNSERISYRIVSTVYLNEQGRRATLRIAHDGVVDLHEFQSLRPPLTGGED